MKKFAFAAVCVLCVMLASVLRHVILSKTIPAAAEYSLRSGCAAVPLPGLMENDSDLIKNI